MKLKVLILALLYYVGLFVVLPYIFILVGSNFRILGLHDPILKIIGLILLLLGVANSGYCYYLFLTQGEGAPISIDPTRKLIVDGPYKFSRNPLYLGQFGIILAEFFWLGSYALFVYLVMFMVAINFWVIPREEVKNKQRFGSQYLDYKKSVPKFF